MTYKSFAEAAARIYAHTNAETLRWMLERPALYGQFLNTKVNPVTLEDYRPTDALRGADYLYGWIQGRGLEALVTHAKALETEDAELSTHLHTAARTLTSALEKLIADDGHAYFCYGPGMVPVRWCKDARAPLEQATPSNVYTYSDAFVAKGLTLAAKSYNLSSLDAHRAYLARVIEAIEQRRFQMSEHDVLDPETARGEPDDFGPRMILLGAAGMLRRAGLADDVAYADRFIDHILNQHFDPASGLLRNVPGEDCATLGHGIEFVGFALDHLPQDADIRIIETLAKILKSSFNTGHIGPGIVLNVSVVTGEPISAWHPWWCLPETIRAAALLYARTSDPEALDIWRQAHDTFYAQYWRPDARLAYQCRTVDGPVDYVPATPDLDPGYHTGLSLLAAIQTVRIR